MHTRTNILFRPLASLLLLAATLSPLPGAWTLPLQPGEHLTYRVAWAILPGAGEIKIDAAPPTGNAGQMLVTATTNTRGLARMLLPFEARSDSLFDVTTGRIVSLHEKSRTRKKQAEHTVTFNHASHEAIYARAVPPEPPRPLEIPSGDPTDLMMGLLQTRTWDIKPGEKRDALVLFDDDFYELTLYALNYEEVRTPIGRFNTLVLQPRMEKTPPKGMFRRGSTVRVWIAQDEHRLPVKFEVEFKIGTGVATLESYRPPPAVVAGSGAPPDRASGGGTASSDAKNSSP
ncbi:MAG: DUF3108 domain-containing protein [Opitutus sp.]